MHKAMYYSDITGDELQCTLCPHHCKIKEGNSGICKVRTNNSGILYSENYEKVLALHVDPVEKKPLYHFFPGKKILSAGTAGCNLKCCFCQNYHISQTGISNNDDLRSLSPDELINAALNQKDNIGIAFTYNEPVIWYEYMIETAKLAKMAKLKTVMVTNGFINAEPFNELVNYIDAFNVDLKFFNTNKYRKYTGAALAPILETIKTIKNQGKHLEITNLVIPGLNDDLNEFINMTGWIATETGKNTVFHISRYFPSYKQYSPPTPLSTLKKFYGVANSILDYVYLGNIYTEEGSDTYCNSCKTKVIARRGNITENINLSKDGHCNICKEKITINS